MTQAPATPEFGDIVENGWASEENPTRKGYFVRSFKRIGRMNPGLTWEVTDRAGRFWEVQPRIIGDRLTVTPQAAALEAQQARIAELEARSEFDELEAQHLADHANRLSDRYRFLFAVLMACANDRAASLQALADRYEKALKAEREWHDLSWSQALALAPDESALGTTEAELSLMRLATLHRDRIEAIDKALSSQGRREGGEG